MYLGPDPQTKAWVGHCACVVETGLATQHWSGKSEGCTYHSQHERAIARGFRACSQENFKITCSEIESEGISCILLYIGIILALPYT